VSYLIRAVTQDSGQGSGPLGEFYTVNKEQLDLYEFCVDMARRWVINTALPFMYSGYGQYPEKLSDGSLLDFKKGEWNDDLKRIVGLEESPVVFYNNLYALLIFLWTWADQDETGEKENIRTKSRIQKALNQIVYNYTSIPVVKEILTKSRYIFTLPGSVFQSGQNPSYMDSAFLPMLTRTIVLFIDYGVGDRNLLEPLVRNLYVDLLQNQNKQQETLFLWSTNKVEIFSTQRAVQAFTFYCIYARGKEQMERASKGEPSEGGLILRNATGTSLIIEARLAEKPPQMAPAKKGVLQPSRPIIATEKFGDYCKNITGWRLDSAIEDDQRVLVEKVLKKAQTILNDFHTGQIGRIRDVFCAKGVST
jgi:hypothetical protein